MVKKYIILADSNNTQPFKIPRQLMEINGEKLIERTVRLLKSYGIEDITITSHDERFDGLGAKRYEPKHNDYDPHKATGYWINAFPLEILDEPTTYLFGDVYYSSDAIKTIVETEADDVLFFCTHNNKSPLYIKHHDEPLAFKVQNTEMFKFFVNELKKKKDRGECVREPITWELYRIMNGWNVNEHVVRDNCIVINDESCDIDNVEDVDLLQNVLSPK